MKNRVLIFALLGPAISCVVLAALSGDFPSFFASSDAFVAVPIVFGVELAPFLLCALIDFFLEEARWWERLVVAAIAGFATVFMAAWMVGDVAQHSWNSWTVQIGLIGAIPAMACSWLAGRSSVGRAGLAP